MNRESTIYQAIIFDLDGVIINSKEHVEQFWLKKLDQYNIHIPEDEREERFHGRPARPTVNDLFAELPQKTRDQIIKECGEYDASVDHYPMIPGAKELLKKCNESGIRLGLVTSALPGKVKTMIAGLNFPSPFEAVITADLVQAGKPDPESYLLAAEKMHLDPQTLLVFEDSISGVQAASDAGATVIGINKTSLKKPLISAGAILVQPNLKDAVLINEPKKGHLFPGGEESKGFLISRSN